MVDPTNDQIFILVGYPTDCVMKKHYLQASDSVRMSNASTIYVQDDETTSYIKPSAGSVSAGADHENLAYVEEEEQRND